MKDIEDIINEMSIDSLKELRFSYKDVLSIDQNDIDKKHPNYFIWKYYTGDITIQEHTQIENPISEYMVYKVYNVIFMLNQSLKWYEDIDFNCLSNQYYDCFSNEVTDLWLMRPEKFQYEEEFKKLIFMLYLVKKEERFRQIALNFYTSNKDASQYIEQCDNDKDMFLIHRKGDCNYKKYYAIEECEPETYDCGTDSKIDEKKNDQNENWIIKRFEGTK